MSTISATLQLKWLTDGSSYLVEDRLWTLPVVRQGRQKRIRRRQN